ncbi:MAG: hypothetical protein MZV63_27140 [Marinilabiliales bacterium]|nr:hypothetical protein [Marinilabiliales bacterium]
MALGNGALLGAIKHLQGYSPMPKDASQLDSCKIRQIEIWLRECNLRAAARHHAHPCDPDTIYFEMDVPADPEFLLRKIRMP